MPRSLKLALDVASLLVLILLFGALALNIVKGDNRVLFLVAGAMIVVLLRIVRLVLGRHEHPS